MHTLENAAETPSPALFFRTATAYQQSAASRAAVDLNVFTEIGASGATAAELAELCGAAERGLRILCDFLTINGFLVKSNSRYELTPDSAFFLDKKSRAYVGGTLSFLQTDMLNDAFKDLTQAVRTGSTALSGNGSVEDDHPVWVEFARAMAPMMMMPAHGVAGCVPCEPARRLKVLDIAAGHGIFGIVLAQQNPNVEVVALDWPNVTAVARENAQKMGVGDRYSAISGNAFDADYGSNYDIVLLTNFLHHFDTPTCETLLRKVYASLNEGGRAAAVDFVVNDDRITPPGTAGFSMMMLATTSKGDAYTFAEFQAMFRNAGFRKSELHALPPSPEQLVLAYK